MKCFRQIITIFLINISTLTVKKIDKNRNVIKDNKNRQNWLEYLEQN